MLLYGDNVLPAKDETAHRTEAQVHFDFLVMADRFGELLSPGIPIRKFIMAS